MSDRKILATAMLVLVVLVVGGGVGFQAWRTNRAPTAVAPPAYQQAPLTITTGQPLRIGAADAPVVVSLYEDFHCPHCAEFETEFGPVLAGAQQAGRVRVELYPMAFIDEGSTAAANAMACAAEAGFGSGYYLGLFANHTRGWSDTQLLDLAAKVGASAGRAFTTCVTSRSHQAWVDSIDTVADARGVQATPAMFLGSAPVDITTLTPETLEAMISDAAR